MMLKIRSKNPDKGIAWKLIDNVKEMNYEYMSPTKAEEIKDKCKETPSYYFRNFKSCGELKRVCLIWVEKNDNTKLLITTDDTVYVLNDAGRTCESVGVYQ